MRGFTVPSVWFYCGQIFKFRHQMEPTPQAAKLFTIPWHVRGFIVILLAKHVVSLWIACGFTVVSVWFYCA